MVSGGISLQTPMVIRFGFTCIGQASSTNQFIASPLTKKRTLLWAPKPEKGILISY